MLESMDLVVILIIILLLFGSSKLPELARSLGRAKKEFKAGMEEGEEGETISKTQEIARNLGIPAEGKSDEELLKEIETKTRALAPDR